MKQVLERLVALAGFGQRRQTTHTALSAEQRAAIDGNTKLVIEELSASAGFTLTLNRESIAWLDGFIERSRCGNIDALHDILASFLGSAIIAVHGGQWIVDAGEVAIAIEPDFIMYPFASVAKHFNEGHDHSVLALFNSIEPMLTLHRKA